MKTWWLSFCDPKRPTGSQFLGVAVVDAHDMVGAVKVAHVLGCNPGGEVKGAALPDELAVRIPGSYRERVLTIDECRKVDKLIGGPGEVTHE